MESLAARISRERCCLLCYEATASECRRWFVAERIVEMSGGARTVVPLAVSEQPF